MRPPTELGQGLGAVEAGVGGVRPRAPWGAACWLLSPETQHSVLKDGGCSVTSGNRSAPLPLPGGARSSQTPRDGAGDQVSSSNLYCSNLGCSRLKRPWPTGPERCTQGTSYPPFPGWVPGGGRLAPWPSPKQSWKGPRGPVWQQRNMAARRGEKGGEGGSRHQGPPRRGASKALMQGPWGLTALAAASCRLSPGLAAPGKWTPLAQGTEVAAAAGLP